MFHRRCRRLEQSALLKVHRFSFELETARIVYMSNDTTPPRSVTLSQTAAIHSIMVSLIEQFVQNYEPHVDFYAEVASLAAARCRAALERHQIPALVTWRAKRPENLIKKLKKRSKYRQYADETDMLIDAMDLAGVRIALYLPSQEGAVLNLLEEMFVVQDVKIHGDVRYRPPFASENGGNNGGGAAHIKKVLFENRPSGYQAIHAHVELGRQMEGVATLPQHQHRYCSTLAEIQIISLLMHVWAELEHRLVYKAESGEASAREKRILGNFYGSVKTAEALLSGVKTSVVERSQRPERIDEKAKL